MDYVIIGNSTAATFAIEGIRSVDREGKITVISAENRPAYGRPLISYYLYGKIPLDRVDYRAPSFYEDNKVEVLLGERAEKIDPAQKKVLLADGKEIPYGRLLVATGSRPFLPPVEGLDGVKNQFTFMTMDDALALEKALSPEKRVLIVGAGLIGLKCAEGIFDRVKSVTVVDMATRILPSILDEEGAALVQSQLERKGLRFLLGDSAAKFTPGAAILKSGREVPFDVLVMAVGVRPNVELVKDAGGEVRRGIAVDERQQTTLPDIYAAGDNCESYDTAAKETRILAILPNAAQQGLVAGKAMTGDGARYAGGAAVNAIGFFGSHIATAGVYTGESYVERGEDCYKKLFYSDNVLKGFILVNRIERAGIYTSLIRDMVPLDSIDFERIKKDPALMVFSRERRTEKLNGGKK